MTFGQNQWALGRMEGRCDSITTASVWAISRPGADLCGLPVPGQTSLVVKLLRVGLTTAEFFQGMREVQKQLMIDFVMEKACVSGNTFRQEGCDG